MRTLSLLCFTICLISSCAPSGAQSKEKEQQQSSAAASASAYTWSILTKDAGYSKTYDYQLLPVNGKLYSMQADFAWVSEDGKTWTKTTLPNIVRNQKYLDYISFNGAVYAIGTFWGKRSNHEYTSQIARTTDMAKWEILTTKSDMPKRISYHPFVFQNKIWIIGGSDGETIYADAWSSADGVHWEKLADELPFGARDSQRFLVYKDQIFMIDRDVWKSKDGVNWEEVLMKMPGGLNLYGFDAVVFDDKMWMIGNFQAGKLGNTIYYSTDGMNWDSEIAPWSPRGGVAAAVFNNKIIITGGKYGGLDHIDPALEYVNDVWQMVKN